jgi:hypothetical protein
MQQRNKCVRMHDEIKLHDVTIVLLVVCGRVPVERQATYRSLTDIVNVLSFFHSAVVLSSSKKLVLLCTVLPAKTIWIPRGFNVSFNS